MGKMAARGTDAREVLAYEGYRELDLVPMPEAIPDLGIDAGFLGTVDHVYKGGRRADVEVSDDEGTTLGYVTVEADPEPHVVAYYIEEEDY